MNDHVLSPLEIEVLLDTFARPDWTPDNDVSDIDKQFIWEKVLPKLKRLDLVVLSLYEGEECYVATERGRAHVQALLNLQLPVQVWVTPPPIPTAIPSGAWVTPGWPK